MREKLDSRKYLLAKYLEEQEGGGSASELLKSTYKNNERQQQHNHTHIEEKLSFQLEEVCLKETMIGKESYSR